MTVPRRAVTCLSSSTFRALLPLPHPENTWPALSLSVRWTSPCRSIQARNFRTATALSREALPRRESDLPPIPGAGGSSKLFKNADDAVADIKSGSVVLSAGFGLCGTAETIIRAMQARGADSLHSLTVVSNNAGASGDDGGLTPLIRGGQVNRCVMSFLGSK